MLRAALDAVVRILAEAVDDVGFSVAELFVMIYAHLFVIVSLGCLDPSHAPWGCML